MVSLPGASHIACFVSCVFELTTSMLVTLLMSQFCILVNSDMTGGKSEFDFREFCGVIWTVRYGTGGCIAGVCVLIFCLSSCRCAWMLSL